MTASSSQAGTPPPSAPEARRSATSVWFAGRGVVELRDEPPREPGPGEVRVRAVASAISHGTEMLVYRGQVSPELDLDLPTLAGSFAFPIKYGYASVGKVTAVGPGVTAPHTGDLVFVHHPHQTEYVVLASLPIPLPPGLQAEYGVFTANLETAVNVLLDAHPRLGERVVVFGQGVVGLLVTQLLRRVGVERLIVVDPIPARRELAVRLGATDALPPDDSLVAGVRERTGGAGADLAIEVSGNQSALALAVDCVAFQGTVVVASWYGTKPVALNLGGAFHRGRLRLVSSQVSHVDPALEPRWSTSRRRDLATSLLPELELAPLISHRIPVQDAAAAYELVDRHPDEVLQVILTYHG